MNWKFWEREPETRESYSDAILRAIVESANAEVEESATAMKEACAGLWSRAFASAVVAPVTNRTAALTPEVMGMIGRSLYDCGEAVFEITVSDGAVQLHPAASWHITGGKRWVYKLDIAHPTSYNTHHRPSDAVIHVRYDTDPGEPWRAIGPLNRSATTDSLSGSLEKRMSQEASGPQGTLIPVPHVDQKLQDDLTGLRGATVLVPSTAEGWDAGLAAQQRPDFKTVRLGADFPESLETTRQGAADHISAAGGVPPSLWRADGEGTAKREAWRQYLHGTVMPVAKIILPELRHKLDEPDLTLTFDELFASDLQGRARAFQSMVGGGMDVTKAAALSGLMMEDA